jgi:tellurite resistance protein
VLPLTTREPFWQRPTPVLLPACLGLIGTGLVWRKASEVLGAPTAIGEIWLGASLAVFLLCLSLYLRRVSARPASLLHDLRMPATRGTVSAGSMSLMLSGAALAPLWAPLAMILWGSGVVLHGFAALLLLRELALMPPDGRPATASLLVPFAGFLVAPQGGVSLGFGIVATALFWLGIAVWLTLTPLVLRHLWRASSPPPPLRPATAILLAPPAITAIGLDTLDPDNPTVPFLFGLSCLTLIALLARLRWLTAGGWSAGWNAFTFPLAAFAGACVIMAERVQSEPVRLGAAVAVTAASLVTLYAVWRLARAWVTGRPVLP